MALTLNNFVGFETGGLEEAAGNTSSPAVVTSTVKTGSYALGGNGRYGVLVFESVSDAGDDQIVGFAYHTVDATPASASVMIGAREDDSLLAADLCWDLLLRTDGDLELQFNSGSNVVITGGPHFIDNTWHYVEVIWQHVASGTIDVFLDGSSIASLSTRDMLGTGTAFDAYHIFPDGTPGTFFDDVYMMSGATGTSDFLGPRTEVLGTYQNTAEDATDQGSALVNGTWANVGETPGTTAEADYNQTAAIEGYTICDEGNRAGPSGDALGTITGAKFLHRLKRTNGSSPTTLDQSYGNSGDGVTKTDRASALTTAYQNFFIVSEAASIMPTNSENFAQGIGQTGNGGRDIFCEEIWAFLLHVHALPTTLADLNFPDQNYYLGPFST